MKKIFLGFAALSLLFGVSSCSKETVEGPDNGNGGIAFKTVLGKQTKATEFSNTSWPNNAPLVVKSYYTGSTTEFNTFNLTYSTSTTSWSYTPAKNQPGYALRYYSYYPAGGVTSPTVTTTGFSFEYAVKASGNPFAGPSEDLQEDLIAVGTTTKDEEVALPFKHLLSQVNFAVQAMFGVKIAISNLSVNNVRSNGKYTFTGENTGQWGEPTTLSSARATYAYYPLATPLANLALGTLSTVQYLGNGNSTYSNTNALMLRPQNFSGEADGTFSFNVTLTIDEDGDGAIDDVVANNLSVKANLGDFETAQWLPGKRYLYLIDFTSYLAGGPITFKVTVADWVNDADNTTVETLHVPKASIKSIETAIALHSAANATANAASKELKTFPISVAQDPTEDNALVITNIMGFDKYDEINIEFPNSSSMTYFNLDVPGWSVTATNGRVKTLTCDEPNTAKYVADMVTVVPTGSDGATVVLDDLNAVVTGLIAVNAAATTAGKPLTVFPITVPKAFAAAIDVDAIPGFDPGDILLVVCPSKEEAEKLTCSDTGWTPVWIGNVLKITKK